MDSSSDPYEGATTSPNGSVDLAPKAAPKNKKPKIHEHLIHGKFLAAEWRTYYEQLQADEDEASGAAKRMLGHRRHLVGLMLGELEAFHSIDEGGL